MIEVRIAQEKKQVWIFDPTTRQRYELAIMNNFQNRQMFSCAENGCIFQTINSFMDYSFPGEPFQIISDESCHPVRQFLQKCRVSPKEAREFLGWTKGRWDHCVYTKRNIALFKDAKNKVYALAGDVLEFHRMQVKMGADSPRPGLTY